MKLASREHKEAYEVSLCSGPHRLLLSGNSPILFESLEPMTAGTPGTVSPEDSDEYEFRKSEPETVAEPISV